MAIGALVAAAILVIAAARARFDEEIEVAPAAPGEGGVLVVATAPIETAPAVEAVAAARSRRRWRGRARDGPGPQHHVSHWLSDLRRARLGAQERLAVSLAVLATANVEARGSVGDSDPLQATEDTLRSFAAVEVVLVTRQRADAKLVREVRRRLDRRVTQVDADAPRRARTAQPSRR